MDDLIIGIKCRVFGEELARLCCDRAAYHRGRVEVYEFQYRLLINNITGAGGSMRDPAEAIKAKMEEHRADAEEMDFISRHILVNAVYELGVDDLRKLGIARKGY